MALHTLLHCMAFGVMSQTYGCDRTGTVSFIDAASYLVGYEGRRHGITSYSLHWHIHCIGVWSYVAASSSDRTGTASFIGYNDAASYLVGYEGKSLCASMCIQHCLSMQLYTLLGMKAGVHVHLYAFLYGFEGWM